VNIIGIPFVILFLGSVRLLSLVEGRIVETMHGERMPRRPLYADRTVHRGLEFGAGWTFARDWRLSASYLCNDFRFERDAVYGNNRLAGVPPQQLRAALRWSRDARFHVEPNVEWVPQGYFIDHANSFRAPGYATVGLKLGGEAAAGWTWFADLRNLGDRRWIAGTNVIADAGGRDGQNFLPGDGRSVYVGLEWRR
jgi:iron complex outermembrane receptor protein